MKAAPVQQRRLADDIVDRIETLILEGTLKPGERLPAERALAEEFGVSRPSLREALQKLVARGLLQSRHGGGTFVSEALGSSFRDPLLQLLEKNPEAQRDLLEFRHTLEGCFAPPEYGGNADAGGWRMIGIEGDVQPLGYSLFSTATGSYHERADHPMSTPNPDELAADGGLAPRPLSPDGRALQGTITTFARFLEPRDPGSMP